MANNRGGRGVSRGSVVLLQGNSGGSDGYSSDCNSNGGGWNGKPVVM